MGKFDALTDEAMRVLRDLKDPLSNGENLACFKDRLLDDADWMDGFVLACLRNDQDGMETARAYISMQATRYSFDEARRYLEGSKPTQDPHDTYGVSRGEL